MGGGLHLLLNVVRRHLRGLCHRRVQSANRRLGGVALDGIPARRRRPQQGRLDTVSPATPTPDRKVNSTDCRNTPLRAIQSGTFVGPLSVVL
jgi:hypothetical protein